MGTGNLTDEQDAVVMHEGSAFVSACPGAGKTRVVVERARKLLTRHRPGRGLALLSFTRGAVSELESRLRRQGLLPHPAYPNYVGTFDSFVWQFIVSPFGLPGTDEAPKLVPDKYQRTIQPFSRAHPVPLYCFDRQSGAMVAELAARHGFRAAGNASRTKAYETSAERSLQKFWSRGELDFTDVRNVALERIKSDRDSQTLAEALACRFHELIVDEAQDCNPEDLKIVDWLRNAGIATKVVCDPHQSIYGFRGGVTEELFKFADSFESESRLTLSGNFRSTQTVCNACAAFRPKKYALPPDRALGSVKDLRSPVRVLIYGGSSVPSQIGERFVEIVSDEGLDLRRSPILAKTKMSGAKAAGAGVLASVGDRTLRLASAVTQFHLSESTSDRVDAMAAVHRISLELGDHLDQETYHQYLTREGLEPGDWRPQVLSIIRQLDYDKSMFVDTEAWLECARDLLRPFVSGRRSIAQLLRKNSALADVLSNEATSPISAKTIHAVKGMQFPAVCVVMTTSTTKGILDYVNGGEHEDRAEDCREVYVAMSRAERLLCVAVPKSQADRLVSQLRASGTDVLAVEL